MKDPDVRFRDLASLRRTEYWLQEFGFGYNPRRLRGFDGVLQLILGICWIRSCEYATCSTISQ